MTEDRVYKAAWHRYHCNKSKCCRSVTIACSNTALPNCLYIGLAITSVMGPPALN